MTEDKSNDKRHELTVPIQSGDGNEIQFPIEKFVNADRVSADLTMPVPTGFKRIPQAMRIDLRQMGEGGDIYPVGGGKVGLGARAYAQMRSKAGIHIVRTESRPAQVNGEPGVAVTVWAVRPRPGVPTIPTCKTVESSYEDFYAKRKATDEKKKVEARYFMARQLETAAINRATRDLLGEPTAYRKADLEERGGLFLLLADVPDPNDPEAKRMMYRQSLGAADELYGPPPAEALPPGSVGEPEPLADHEMVPAVEEDPFGPVPPDETAAAPASFPDLPSWCAPFARDENGRPRWSSISRVELEKIARARLIEIDYDFEDDPAGLVDDGKAKRWEIVAGKLLDHEQGGQ